MRAINYSDKAIEKINEKLQDVDFCGGSWSDEDLEFIRKEIKDFYIKEQRHTCIYCRQVFKSNNGRIWDVEHVVSRESVHEFMFEPKNLCVSCPECNQRKGANKVTNSKARKRLPSNSMDYAIVHPHFDDYQEHIEAIKPGEFYVSKTKKGEKTIAICGLNRFYEFAGYDQAVTANNQIFQYATLLSNTDNEEQRKNLLREIAALAIGQLVAVEANK
ncbi:HNH endonuclease [compost metagenome]